MRGHRLQDQAVQSQEALWMRHTAATKIAAVWRGGQSRTQSRADIAAQKQARLDSAASIIQVSRLQSPKIPVPLMSPSKFYLMTMLLAIELVSSTLTMVLHTGSCEEVAPQVLLCSQGTSTAEARQGLCGRNRQPGHRTSHRLLRWQGDNGRTDEEAACISSRHSVWHEPSCSKGHSAGLHFCGICLQRS